MIPDYKKIEKEHQNIKIGDKVRRKDDHTTTGMVTEKTDKGFYINNQKVYRTAMNWEKF